MSQNGTIAHPTFAQHLKYLAGRTLPDEFIPWVIEDITGPGAARRYTTRCIVPLLPILVGLLLIPGPWIIRISMVLLLFLPFVYFLLALKKIYLRHRLVSHGLSPALLDVHEKKKMDEEKQAYESRYRP
ncbi:DUF5313 family protein [Rhodococcus sp. C3V]|uniref:DUF5313 family protein n=1 Tax=Rhodococcus sp. C3V TaxID=3034165 RepID=UPI0023E0C92D|nr:DUF5313 family protein [Rhodococcus sp. C3V]MDF3320001.1 DUF5313 family protein [Rhodococcus sp. C3V]